MDLYLSKNDVNDADEYKDKVSGPAKEQVRPGLGTVKLHNNDRYTPWSM